VALSFTARSVAHGITMIKLLSNETAAQLPLSVPGISVTDIANASEPQQFAVRFILPKIESLSELFCLNPQISNTVTVQNRSLTASLNEHVNIVSEITCIPETAAFELPKGKIAGNFSAASVQITDSTPNSAYVVRGYFETNNLFIKPGQSVCLVALGNIWIDTLEIAADSTLTLIATQGEIILGAALSSPLPTNFAILSGTQLQRGASWSAHECLANLAYLSGE